jgi:hypothetical protein
MLLPSAAPEQRLCAPAPRCEEIPVNARALFKKENMKESGDNVKEFTLFFR